MAKERQGEKKYWHDSELPISPFGALSVGMPILTNIIQTVDG
jgi:hypothetical protein